MDNADVHAVASAGFAPGLAMTPTQALTTRFEIDAGNVLATGPMPGAAATIAAALGEPRQGVCIGELRLMIRYEDASELSELSAVHRLPNAPSWFHGIANLRGKLTPVFDLGTYLGTASDPAAKRMLLVLAHGADAAGILIEGQPERLRVSAGNRTDNGAAPERLRPHLRGASASNGRIWFELDVRSLLAEIEQALESSQ